MNDKPSEDIVVARANIGGTIIMWGIQECINEAQKKLSSRTLYKQLDLDSSEDYVRIIINFLNDLKNSKNVNDELASSLTPDETKFLVN